MPVQRAKKWVQNRDGTTRGREKKRGFKRAFAHTVPTNGKRRYTINLLCYVENPYNASYWPYFTLVHLPLFSFHSSWMRAWGSLSCMCVRAYGFCFCSFYSTILARMNATVLECDRMSEQMGTRVWQTHRQPHITLTYAWSTNIKWNAPARRRTQNSH